MNTKTRTDTGTHGNNNWNTTIPATFGVETRFEVNPEAGVTFRAARETEFDRLRGKLLDELLGAAGDPDLYTGFRRAANDAAALAWLTPYPLLVFPELLAERAREARVRVFKQKEVRTRSRGLLRVAA